MTLIEQTVCFSSKIKYVRHCDEMCSKWGGDKDLMQISLI